MTETYVCEQCGDPTAGDALCAPCLSKLEQAAHPPFARLAPDGASELARRIRDRLREHLSLKPACALCAARPTLLNELLSAEEASAEIVFTLDQVASLSRERGIDVERRLFESLAEAAKTWHSRLENLVVRVGAIELAEGVEHAEAAT